MRSAVLASALGVALLAPSAGAQVDDYRQIEFPPLAEFQIPVPEVYDLANGMKVFLLEDHELPLVEITARIRTGAVYEPAGKTGLAGISGSVQRTGGTRSMSGDEIDDFLESRAASVETSIGATVGVASMDCLADDVDAVLPVFVEVLRFPDFSQDKLELAKIQANSGISRRNDDVGAITGREFNRLIYGAGSPLSQTPEYATIAAITRDDLRAWHARYYHPNNIYIGVVGDFDSAAMKRKLAAAFGDWPAGPAFDEPEIDVATAEERGVFFVEKSDVTQANIRIGHLGITYQNPDYFPVVVMNEVLGGGFSARLFSRIRSAQGLAYSVGGRVGAAFLYPGVTSFGMQTKSGTMAEAVDALYKEIRGMISEPATERELQLAKDSLLNSFIFNYASKDQVLGKQMLFTYYGLPSDFLERYRGNIERVTAADVLRVAKTYLHPDRAKLLVVGRSSDFDRPLTTFGEVTELDITIPPPPSLEPELEATAESHAEGAALLARMRGALTGDAPDRLESFRMVDKMVVSMQGQSLALEQDFTMVLPDKIYVSLKMPMGEQTMMVSEGRGYQTMGPQSRDMPAEQVDDELADLGRNLLYIARYGGPSEVEAIAGGSAEVDGTACRWVEVSYEVTSSRLCIAADGRVLAQTYQSTHPFTGAPGNFEVVYSDYREVDGFLVPFRQTTSIDGEAFATTTRESAEINPEIDATLFVRPAA
jgi:predicted Zn-dependent peptidase